MKRYLSLFVMISALACGSSKKNPFPPPFDATLDSGQDVVKTDIPVETKAEDVINDTSDTVNEVADTSEEVSGPVKCKTNADCNKANLQLGECQIKVCNHKTGYCEADWNKNCCMDKVFLNAGFEDGLPSGWKITQDTDKEDKVTWSVVSKRAIDGKKSLYIGDPDCHTYYNGPMTDCKPDDKLGNAGGHVRVVLDTAPISLPPTKGSFIMSFYIWSEVQGLLPNIKDVNQPDQLRIQVLYGQKFVKHDDLFSTVKIQQSTKGRFKFIAADFNSYKGQTIKVRLIFDTLSKQDNFHEGIYIDDLKIESVCDLDSCRSDDPASPDNDDCTIDDCILFTNSPDLGYYAHPKDLYCGGECLPESVKTDCPNDDPCKKVECKDHKCVFTDIVPCCNPRNLFQDGFESDKDLSGYSVMEGQQNKSVRWRLSDKRAAKGSKSLYYGDNVKGDYDSNGTANYGSIDTPFVDVPQDGYTSLTFDLFLSTEWDGKDKYLNPAKSDVFKVEAIQRTGEGLDVTETLLWDSSQIKGTTKGKFLPVGIDLSDFAGKKIAIRFSFATGDARENTNEGLYIDNISIDANNCNHIECKGAYDCRVDGVCRTGECKDDNTCDVTTTSDGCCAFDIDCDDGSDCTNDWCDENNTCQHQFFEGPLCCQPKDIVEFNFDGGKLPDGFKVENTCSPISSSDPKCPGWQVSDKKSNSGLYSLYFGNGKDYQMAGTQNAASAGVVETSPFLMPLWGITRVSFNCLILIDPKDKEQTGVDMLNLEAVKVNDDGSDGDAVTLAGRGTGIPLISEDANHFDQVTKIDINKYAPQFRGRKIRLRFTFNSQDQSNNNGLGVFIDDLKVVKACPQPASK